MQNVAKLQRVQNALARVVTESSRRDHIHPVLKELHWLPVSERIKYKVALITFKTLSTQQPQYLANLVTPYKPVRDLCSSTQHRFTSHRTNKVIGNTPSVSDLKLFGTVYHQLLGKWIT